MLLHIIRDLKGSKRIFEEIGLSISSSQASLVTNTAALGGRGFIWMYRSSGRVDIRNPEMQQPFDKLVPKGRPVV